MTTIDKKLVYYDAKQIWQKTIIKNNKDKKYLIRQKSKGEKSGKSKKNNN